VFSQIRYTLFVWQSDCVNRPNRKR